MDQMRLVATNLTTNVELRGSQSQTAPPPPPRQ